MSAGASTSNSSTSQQTAPWAPAQPYLNSLLSQASDLYQSQQGQTAYPNTVAPFSPQTQQALDLTQQRALAGSPLVSQADQSVSTLMQPMTAPGNAALAAQLSGYADPGNAYIQAGGGSNAALNQAAAMAGSIGAGSLNPGTANLSAAAVNPYLNQMFQAESQPVIDAVNAQFGLGGRTGSGADQQELTRNLGDLASQVYGNNFLNEQQLGLNAYTAQNAAQTNAYTAQNNALASGAGLLSSLGQNQAQRQLAAGSQLSSNALNQQSLIGSAAAALNNQYNSGNNLQLAAAGLAPQLAASDYTDLQNLLNVGGAYDAQNQNILNNQLAAWQYAQAQPWNILAAYGGALTGIGGLGSSSSGNSSGTSFKAGF